MRPIHVAMSWSTPFVTRPHWDSRADSLSGNTVEDRAAGYSQLAHLGLLRVAVVGYLSRQPCLMTRSKVKKKTTQNKYCQISNRTKYTDNLVLDEGKREQIRDIPTKDNI
jgi:hypothetical protein